MVDIKKYSDIDLYGLIGANSTSTEAEIRKAYRKKALECHPDKNPDNPKAAELFQELSKALEILTDSAAKAAYDKILDARKAAEIRNRQLDGKRKKFKEDLEQREREANANVRTFSHSYTISKSDEERLREQVERLRKEGSKLVEEEQEFLRKQLQEEKLKRQTYYDSSQHRIKIKWNSTKEDSTNGGYSEEILRRFLQKYGDIVAFVMSPKKKGSALVEFKTKEAAEMAVSYEKGNLSNPLTLEWIGKPPSTNTSGKNSTVNEKDFESLVLRQMRQAEERKRLIEQMAKEDADESENAKS